MKRVRWDRVIGMLLVIFIIYSFIDIIVSKPVIKETPEGSYTCSGHILKICSGNNEVADYLGVE